MRMAHVDALSRHPVSEPNPLNETHVIDVLNVNMKDWIATVQENDDEVKRIKQILLDNDSKYVADVRNNYQLKGEHVYRQLDKGLRWVVPRGVRWQILRINHDDVGHFVFEKTLNRLQATYWFPKMRRFTKKYVAASLECDTIRHPADQKRECSIPSLKLKSHFTPFMLLI